MSTLLPPLRSRPAAALRRLRVALLAAACLPAAAAAESPRIGLVLGGGGARGAAHIGVLEVLEELRVPIDCVAGTSFGALVAGAWAAGVTPARMRQVMAETDWADIFQDNPAYTELNPRYKQLLQRYLPSSESGVDADGVSYPPGAVAGQKIKLFINRLVRADLGEPDVGSLRLPVSIVATDIGTGARVVFRDGSLTQAMRASMSVPTLMAPAEIDGRKLVDGGLVDNLPVREVHELCQPDVVIAVNVGSPLLPAQSVGSLLSVTAQLVALLTEQNVSLSLERLRPGDIYLKPVLDGLTAGDFARHDEAAARGREAALFVRAALSALALDATAWAARRQALAGRSEVAAGAAPPRIDEIVIDGLELVRAEVVRRHLRQREGDRLDSARLTEDLQRVYGDGWYQSVDYRLLRQHDRQILRISPVEKAWGPDYLRFAINADSSLSQGSTFSLRAALHRTWINRLGGEWLLSTEIGNRSGLAFEFHQPLDPAQRWFAELDLASGWSHRDLYEDGQRVSRFQIFRSAAEVAFGLNLGRLGDLRAGWVEKVTRAKLETGQGLYPRDPQYLGGAVLTLDLDQLNRLYFPTDGWAAHLRYFHSRRDDYSRASLNLRAARSLGPWVLAGRLHLVGSPRGRLPAVDAAALGGFLNLSAYATEQLQADTVQYGHLRAERILGRAPLGLRGDLRLGLALEAGRLRGAYTEMRLDGRWTNSLTAYLGGETPFGPVYVGLGQSTRGDTNAYLFLGTP